MSMRTTPRFWWALAFLVLPASVVFAQSPVGSITRTVLDVEIDAFGTGEFILAVDGEPVYPETVIRTGYDSWAYLKIEGESHTVAPLSVTPVDSFLQARRRSRGRGFFGNLIRELTRSLAPPEEEEIVAGGRASGVEGPSTTWVFDVDANELYREAQDSLEAEDYESAVETLRLIEFPDEGDFSVENYYVDLSYALMGMGDSHAAMAAGFDYANAEPDPAEAGLLTPRLQLLSGIAAYYAGEDAVANATLEAYLEAVPLTEAVPEAVVARIKLLQAEGANSQAARLQSEARRAQPNVDWAAMLAN